MRSRRSVTPAEISDRDRMRDAGAAAERSQLVTAFRGADLDATAADRLDHTRSVLMGRLMRHSDDFRATAALKALDTFTADARMRAGSAEPDRLRHQGESGTSTARRWLHLGGGA